MDFMDRTLEHSAMQNFCERKNFSLPPFFDANLESFSKRVLKNLHRDLSLLIPKISHPPREKQKKARKTVFN